MNKKALLDVIFWISAVAAGILLIAEVWMLIDGGIKKVLSSASGPTFFVALALFLLNMILILKSEWKIN